MKLSKFTSAVLALAAFGSAQADQTLLSEGFDDFASIASSGWSTANLSASPVSGWFQGNAGVFEAQSGAPSSYAAANFLLTGAGAISAWLVTPEISLHGGEALSFALRSEWVDGVPFADGLRVLFGSGGSADTAHFDTVLMTLPTVPPEWLVFSIQLPTPIGATTGRIAFEYFSADAANANYLGIDQVSITTAVPEPASALLLGLGAMALGLRRRLAAA